MEITINIPKGVNINDFIKSQLCININGDIPNNINNIIESISVEPTNPVKPSKPLNKEEILLEFQI